MPKYEGFGHSVLIISASEAFDTAVRKSLRGFASIESRKHAASARRYLLERYYDLIVINAPLPDESGEQLAKDIAESGRASVLMAVPSEVYGDALEHVSDYGILVISKPVSAGLLDKALRFLTAFQNRVQKVERQVLAAEEKLQELRIVTKAKFYLVENEHLTEDEAHRKIGKLAMNHGVSRKIIAERIIESYEE